MNGTPTLEVLYRPVREGLHEVRRIIDRIWQEALELVKVDTGPGPSAEGKMLRPALCLLSAGAIGGAQPPRYVELAAAFETLHLASLIHDDVVDHARVRRGNTALNVLWDNHAAVLGGDYLLARALELLSTYDSRAIVSGALAALRRMAEGELSFFGRDDGHVGEQECLMLADRKTAGLFAETCSAPSHLIDMEYHEALHRFGAALGAAFQLVDDILDLTQPASSLGKPSCGDVVEGKTTLPIMHIRAALDAPGRQHLDSLRNAEIKDEDRAWIAEQALQTKAVEKTQRIARQYADKALYEIGALPKTEYRAAMAGLVEFVLVRES